MNVVADRAFVDRSAALRRSRWLNAATIGWNSVEGVVAVAAGVAAGSVSLIGFGFDSAIEVSAALILTWRLHQERRTGCMQDADRRATRLIAVSFGLLAVYVGFEAVRDLVSEARPEASLIGIVIAGLSLLVMPFLARAKRRLAPALGSTAVVADANQTNLCALLSAVVLAGLGANAAFGWWWADPVAGLGIAGLAAWEASRTWRAESLEDTCCRVTGLNRATLVAVGVAALLAGSIGWYIGSHSDRPPTPDSVAVGFLQDMITHHEQALTLSNLQLSSGSEASVKTFASEILLSQSYEVGLMERQLAEWGYERGARSQAMEWMGHPVEPQSMPGMASETELDALLDAQGQAVDALFVRLMQDHHRGGVHMAAYAADHVDHPFVQEIAERMARNQRAEINELESTRKALDLAADPPGFRPDPMPKSDSGHSAGH